MRIGSKSEDSYNDRSYSGLVNRIRDGVALADHQRKVMKRCGLTVEDFRNQPTDAEKIEMVNRMRGREAK